MNESKSLKMAIQDKYAKVARGGCCAPQGDSGCCGDDYAVFSDDYKEQPGYVAEADLNLGCGLPTKYAGITSGNTVLDLGSGVGNDVFVARSLTGEKGRVIGVDMTPEMIEKAIINNRRLGYDNVEFHLAEIENLPLEDNSVDVVISNCVLNLVPDKQRAFSEIYRVLKPGGHFCISDVVMEGDLPETLKQSAALYAGCISGALRKSEYLSVIEKAGFSRVAIQTEKTIVLPDSLLAAHVSKGEIAVFRESGVGIKSITVNAWKQGE